jgi:hypothetical protein
MHNLDEIQANDDEQRKNRYAGQYEADAGTKLRAHRGNRQASPKRGGATRGNKPFIARNDVALCIHVNSGKRRYRAKILIFKPCDNGLAVLDRLGEFHSHCGVAHHYRDESDVGEDEDAYET